MSLEFVEQCPLCKGNLFNRFLICEDHTTTGEKFHLERCEACGFLLTNPRPLEAQSSTYYQSAEYISHASGPRNFFDYIYLIFRRFTIKWKFNLVKPHLRKKILLDVGCGTGKFLRYCQLQQVNVYGVEPSRQARELTNASHIPVVESLGKLPEMKFDIITLWHVLEHIYDLPSTLSNLKNRLADNGTIFIAVPNVESEDAKVYQENWAAFDVPRHLWHFSKSTMKILVENSGLKVKEIIPMKLDAYYVSLLSAKYATKKLTFLTVLKALRVAFHSNQCARKQMNYSSLIYLIEK